MRLNRGQFGLLAGLLLGFSVSLLMASRNGSGTYSLPTGNPVASGTTISSSWANNTLADLATETTNSLDRNGRGAMAAPLQLAAGSAGAPALTFSAETSSGLYRAGASDLRLSIGGNDLERWTGSTCAINRNLTVTTTLTGDALTVTGGSASGAGLNATGGSTDGTGIVGTSGGAGGDGVRGFGAVGTSSRGGYFQGGSGAGWGLLAVGGTGAKAIHAQGDGIGVGIQAIGGASGAGGIFTNGMAATGGTRQDALIVTNGDIKLDGVAAPTSTTAVKNRVTPVNVAKAWGRLALGSGSPTVTAGFNVASISCATKTVTVNLAQAFSASSYALLTTSTYGTGATSFQCSATSASQFQCVQYTSGSQDDLCAVGGSVSFVAYGAQ